MTSSFSPKQVARAIGVSESSLKRWCDDGLLPVVRTAGGHRRLPVQGVLDFVREQGREIVRPEVLGLPPTSGRGEFVVERGRVNFREALIGGDEILARKVLVDLHLARIPIATIADHVVARAFHDIGDRWECQEVEIYQERLGCEIALRALFELRSLSTLEEGNGPEAIGGAASGDYYTLPTAIAELVLRDVGWRARSLGTCLPFATLAESIRNIDPRLFWLSVSHVDDEDAFADGFAELDRLTAETGTRLVLGGRGLTQRLLAAAPRATHCASMTDLVAAAGECIDTTAPGRS